MSMKFLVHDDRVGSATMGMKVLEEILDKEKISMPIRKLILMN